MPAEDDKLTQELKLSFGVTLLSQWLFIASWFFLICLPFSFFSRVHHYDPQTQAIVYSRWAWEWTVVCVVAWCCTAYLSYRLTGGRRNPVIWDNNK